MSSGSISSRFAVGVRLAMPLGMALVFALPGCATIRGFVPRLVAPEKITRARIRIPAPRELPGLVGRLQYERVRSGDTLLDIARGAGLGYQQVQDANPGVDEWVPKPDTKLELPSRWIVPRSKYRGVVINIPEMRLYLFPETAQPGTEVEVRTWPIGIGTDETPSPVVSFKIRSKEQNPTWVIPDSILKTRDDPRRVIPPGPDNPLGDYRMRLSYDLYAIHGTDTPWAIGRLTTHGCIRLYPEDIPELFDLVRIGTPGELIYQPVKLGKEAGDVYVEIHPDIYRRIPNFERHALRELERSGVQSQVDPELFRAAVKAKRGVPTNVTRAPAERL
ncbi:MAG: L,D-transpeptidase family protein [Candidatus Binatia bacterium]